MSHPLVIITEDLDPEPEAWLAERCEVVRCATDDARLPALLGRASGLVVRTYTQVNEALLSAAPMLKVVGRAGVGLENIDIDACRTRGIAVVHTPDANTNAVAEYTIALLLDALRPRMYLESAPPASEWHDLRRKHVARRELNELTLGIWGMGRIGQAVAKAARGMGMRIIYNDLLEISPEKRWGGEPVSVDELLAKSDVLSVHVDERAANRGLVRASALERVRNDVVLINTSRGLVVDATALAAFLQASPDAKAMLDVHDPEPIDPGYPLLGIPNAWLAPHLASGTAGAKRRMSWVVRQVWEVLAR